MTIPRILLVTAAVLPAATAAAAATDARFPDSGAVDREAVAVTVYNGNLALVREVRQVRFDRSGVGTLRFMDVPSEIDPRTVHLEVLGRKGAARLLEQNYEYDLISPQKLMEKYVGREVEIVEKAEDLSERRVRAELLSVNGGPVYRAGDRIVLFQEGQVTLPGIPPDLVSRPTLVWTLDVERPGERRIEVSYLTSGMTWQADYVAVLDQEDAHLDLSGWVTLANRSGASFEDAVLKVVAGDVRRLGRQLSRAAPMDQEKMALSGFAEEGLFEYHLYTLERPTTIKDNQTKQLSLLTAGGVPVRKRLLLYGQPGWYRQQMGTRTRGEKVTVLLEFDNDERGGLGMPLPRGTVRVYKRDRSGAEQFVGEDAIDHTPRGETVRLTVGKAFDVVADRKQTDFRVLGKRRSESAFEIAIRNHKDEPVTVTVREPVGGDWRLLSSSHEGKKLDAGTLEFEVAVPARGEAVLQYRIETRW